MNDAGYNINMAFDGPAAIDFYVSVLEEYPYQNDTEVFNSQRSIVYTQVMGYQNDIDSINLKADETFVG